MARLPVRDTCPAHKQWYVCAVGDYHGCCSVDPCRTGVCPDDDTLISMSTSSTTSLTSRTNTKATQDVALSTLTSATSLTTASSTATAFPTAQSVTTSVKTTDQHGMVIGGVVGGIIGFLLLLGLALFLWFSRRKKPGEKVAAYTLVALGGLRSKREGRQRPGLATEGRAMNRPSMDSPSDNCILLTP